MSEKKKGLFARLFHGLGIIPEFVRDRKEPGRKDRTGEFYSGFDLLFLRNRHDPRQYRNRDADFTDTVEEGVQNAVIKEHLCGQKLAARILFEL